MPLQYDNEGGSWGRLSKGWPELVFASKDEADRAFIACSKTKTVPYGSYVLVEATVLRVETEALKKKLTEYLSASPYKTYADLRQHFIDTGLWDGQEIRRREMLAKTFAQLTVAEIEAVARLMEEAQRDVFFCAVREARERIDPSCVPDPPRDRD